jgi:DNA-binding winged helix-turn-helix (wHTH) protein
MAVEVALEMPTEKRVLYEFGPFRADPDKQILLRQDQVVPVTPKVSGAAQR